ncbi:hypothetical protein [Aestuariimicrobium ganziense]|uniref:hypothetical protein n=1 Tax=Aestuariimicrobium ganziense TaxID=2773677 RepID=UPI00194264CA|nr:hypothetical protein [Aestuariimicrobium ganziense]
MPVADSKDVRLRNRALLPSSLRDVGQATTTELTAATGLSRPTVEAILDGELGAVVSRADGVVATPGRPARAWQLVPPPGQALGVDVGVHLVRAKAVDRSGTVVAGVTLPVGGR